jgi:hypothetical protein
VTSPLLERGEFVERDYSCNEIREMKVAYQSRAGFQYSKLYTTVLFRNRIDKDLVTLYYVGKGGQDIPHVDKGYMYATFRDGHDYKHVAQLIEAEPASERVPTRVCDIGLCIPECECVPN